MIDTKSPEFEIGRRIGHALVVYVGIRFIVKGVKLIVKSGKILLYGPV